jgi:D-alanyl-D-alanine carboxypeptidase
MRRIPQQAKPAPPPRLVIGPPAVRHGFDPPLSGNAALVLDAGTGRVLWALHPHLRRRIASTTKVMTATLALERLRPQSVVRVSAQAPRAYPNREGLRAHERVPAWKLFYGLLLYSGNDDALALAIATAGSRPAFVDAMNAKAHELGMRNTHFSTPSGVVDRDNYSTAWDMAILARYAMQNPRFREVVRTPRKSVPWSAPTFGKLYVNTNRLLTSYPGANGIKTGWTTIARHCLVASATRHGRSLIVVVLHSENAFADAARLLDLGFRVRG